MGDPQRRLCYGFRAGQKRANPVSNTELDSINVLLIDDQAFARLTVKSLLGNLGVGRVATAENGLEAIQCLRQADPRIDIIICDIDMPEMTGWEFIREIRDGTIPNYEHIPILLLTGLETKSAMAEWVKTNTKQHRIDGFIAKPATANRLRAMMVRVLGLSAE